MEPDELRNLVAVMRELGIRSLKTADVELVLDPAPHPAPAVTVPLAASTPPRTFEDVLFAHTGRSRSRDSNNSAQGAPP